MRHVSKTAWFEKQNADKHNRSVFLRFSEHTKMQRTNGVGCEESVPGDTVYQERSPTVEEGN